MILDISFSPTTNDDCFRVLLVNGKAVSLCGNRGCNDVPFVKYGLDDRGFESRQGLRIFLFTTAFRPALRVSQPPIQWVPDKADEA